MLQPRQRARCKHSNSAFLRLWGFYPDKTRLQRIRIYFCPPLGAKTIYVYAAPPSGALVLIGSRPAASSSLPNQTPDATCRWTAASPRTTSSGRPRRRALSPSAPRPRGSSPRSPSANFRGSLETSPRRRLECAFPCRCEQRPPPISVLYPSQSPWIRPSLASHAQDSLGDLCGLRNLSMAAGIVRIGLPSSRQESEGCHPIIARRISGCHFQDLVLGVEETICSWHHSGLRRCLRRHAHGGPFASTGPPLASSCCAWTTSCGHPPL